MTLISRKSHAKYKLKFKYSGLPKNSPSGNQLNRAFYEYHIFHIVWSTAQSDNGHRKNSTLKLAFVVVVVATSWINLTERCSVVSKTSSAPIRIKVAHVPVCVRSSNFCWLLRYELCLTTFVSLNVTKETHTNFHIAFEFAYFVNEQWKTCQNRNGKSFCCWFCWKGERVIEKKRRPEKNRRKDNRNGMASLHPFQEFIFCQF